MFMNTCVIAVGDLIFSTLSFDRTPGLKNSEFRVLDGHLRPVSGPRRVKSPQVYPMCVCVRDPSVLAPLLSNQMMTEDHGASTAPHHVHFDFMFGSERRALAWPRSSGQNYCLTPAKCEVNRSAGNTSDTFSSGGICCLT